MYLFIYFNSVLRPFQDYYSSYETGENGRTLRKKDLAHEQAELGLSHMWPERGSNPHQTLKLLRNNALNRSATGAAIYGSLLLILSLKTILQFWHRESGIAPGYFLE